MYYSFYIYPQKMKIKSKYICICMYVCVCVFEMKYKNQTIPTFIFQLVQLDALLIKMI